MGSTVNTYDHVCIKNTYALTIQREISRLFIIHLYSSLQIPACLILQDIIKDNDTYILQSNK
jgi:hypothetical protein